MSTNLCEHVGDVTKFRLICSNVNSISNIMASRDPTLRLGGSLGSNAESNATSTEHFCLDFGTRRAER